jgi:hypothetical protein
VRLCSFHMSFMQALEQMWDSLQPEHRAVVGVPHHSQGLDLREDMTVLHRATSVSPRRGHELNLGIGVSEALSKIFTSRP